MKFNSRPIAYFVFRAPILLENCGVRSRTTSFIIHVSAALALCLALFRAPQAHAARTLQWETHPGYRVAGLSVASSGTVGFKALAGAETGIRFTNTLTQARALANANLMNGAGLALGDYNGDGLCDVYLCDLGGRNVLYKNLGDWKFQDATQEAGAACPGQTSTGAAFGDVDGDGDLDLLVVSMGGPHACFLNDGKGRFRNVIQSAGFTSNLGATSMALADIDGNGTLDLYVANYGLTSILRSGGALSITMVNGQPVVRGRYARRIKILNGMMFELGEPDALYLNDGKGAFKPVSWTDGWFVDEHGKPLDDAPWDQGLSVMFRDMNGDGAPDIYVCNDAFTPDRCWINDGRGRFKALPQLAWRSTSYFSMNADFADVDRDGDDDLLVADMLSRQHRLALTQKAQLAPQPRLPGEIDTPVQMRRNTLLLNRGDGTYAEIANYSGLSASEWTWNVTFTDVDLDGWEDLLVGNGFLFNMDDADSLHRVRSMGPLSVAESRRMILTFPTLSTPNVAFHNQRDLTFQETGKAWGFDSLEISSAKAMADLDNDGDLDVVVNCLNGPALVYQNLASAPRLAVRLRGKAPNTQGIGAKIKVLGGPVTQTQEVINGGRYMAGDDPVRVFATGNATQLTVEVAWRNGSQSVVSNCLPNHICEIHEPAASAAPARLARPEPEVQPLFEDASSLLGHKHVETPFEDFDLQPLLPNRLSQLGPGAAWTDLDGDGRDDLVVGTGKGGKLAVYRNTGTGFQLLDSPALTTADRDQTAVLGFPAASGRHSLLVGSSSFEDGLTNKESVLRYDYSNGMLSKAPGLAGWRASVGPMAMTDMNGDGLLELFVGGRVVPGRYPEAASSFLFTSRDGSWSLDAKRSEVLRNVGLVSGAVWSDLENDGFPELILACEWGPVRVFRNRSGTLTEATAELGLAGFTGWWTGVTTGDFDNDGRLDIVAGNWGLNTPYHAGPQRPVRLYYGDWRGTGRLDLLEAYHDEQMGIVPRRDFGAVSSALPFVREKFGTFMAFAEASLQQILGDRMRQTAELQANTLASMMFLNRGGRFEPVALPAEAQFAPVFAVNVADFDGDGNEDVFLGQNFFATHSDMVRFDAGRGLLLRGDGKGRVSPVPARDSGIYVYGEQRGAAVSDFDRDGRADLVVTQNAAETKLLRNARAKPGLRIRVQGPPGNPSGVGALIRLESGAAKGPVREIRAGSGYWSQDSAMAVMGSPSDPERIRVQWPGGKHLIRDIEKGAREITVRWN